MEPPCTDSVLQVVYMTDGETSGLLKKYIYMYTAKRGLRELAQVQDNGLLTAASALRPDGNCAKCGICPPNIRCSRHAYKRRRDVEVGRGLKTIKECL